MLVGRLGAAEGQLRDSTVAILGTASPAITGALLLGGPHHTPGFLIKKLLVKKFRGWISVKKRNFVTRGGGGLEKHISNK